jgi:hypothetical protein
MFSSAQASRNRLRSVGANIGTLARIDALLLPFVLTIVLALAGPECLAATNSNDDVTNPAKMAKTGDAATAPDPGSQGPAVSDGSNVKEGVNALAFTESQPPFAVNDLLKVRSAGEKSLRGSEEQARRSPGGPSNWCIDLRWRDYTAIPASRIRRSRSVDARFPGTHPDVEPHGPAGCCSGHRRHVARGTYVKEPTCLGETALVVATDDRNRRKYRRHRAQHNPALIAQARLTPSLRSTPMHKLAR